MFKLVDSHFEFAESALQIIADLPDHKYFGLLALIAVISIAYFYFKYSNRAQ